MIDGIRGRQRFDALPPKDREMMNNMVVGDHSGDHFQPPQAVAAAEEQQPQTNTADSVLPGASGPPAKGKRSLVDWWRNLTTKQKVLCTAAAVLVVSGAVIGSYFLFFTSSPPPKKAPVAQKPAPVEQPKPTTVASTLTGLQVDPSVNDRPVTAIMIENSADARPQSGLNQAGVVFEAVAEGGITRFVTLFQDSEPDYIGPVRSVRPYYLQWALGFDAAIAHAGGSAEALNDITQWGVKDLNHNANYFWRVNNRAAPHNLYTSIAKLREYEGQKGFGKANYTGLVRKAAEAPLATPIARSIDFKISSATFNAHYDYDTSTNSYKRSEGGASHTDERSGAQLAPKVVVALVLPQGKNGIYTTYQTIGSGTVYVFQDGGVTQGAWRKDGNNAQIVLTTSDGQPLPLNPGQTWFTALGSASSMSYSP